MQTLDDTELVALQRVFVQLQQDYNEDVIGVLMKLGAFRGVQGEALVALARKLEGRAAPVRAAQTKHVRVTEALGPYCEDHHPARVGQEYVGDHHWPLAVLMPPAVIDTLKKNDLRLESRRYRFTITVEAVEID